MTKSRHKPITMDRGGPAQLDRNPVFLSDISAGYAAAASSGWLK
jgi:hypothetical protein